MERVLVVSGSERGREFLRELLRGQEYGQGFFADNSGEARRRMAEDDFSLVIINAPLRDESGEQLALWAAQSTDAGVLLLVKAEIADEVSARVEDSGAMVLPKPISRQFFCQSLKLVSAARRRMLGLKNENTRLQKQIDDIRLVDRAKCVFRFYGAAGPPVHREKSHGSAGFPPGGGGGYSPDLRKLTPRLTVRNQNRPARA